MGFGNSTGQASTVRSWMCSFVDVQARWDTAGIDRYETVCGEADESVIQYWHPPAFHVPVIVPEVPLLLLGKHTDGRVTRSRKLCCVLARLSSVRR